MNMININNKPPNIGQYIVAIRACILGQLSVKIHKNELLSCDSVTSDTYSYIRHLTNNIVTGCMVHRDSPRFTRFRLAYKNEGYRP